VEVTRHEEGSVEAEQAAEAEEAESAGEDPVVWTTLGPLPRWVPGPTTRWAPGTTRLALHGT
jgi:hypothetical protein